MNSFEEFVVEFARVAPKTWGQVAVALVTVDPDEAAAVAGLPHASVLLESGSVRSVGLANVAHNLIADDLVAMTSERDWWKAQACQACKHDEGNG